MVQRKAQTETDYCKQILVHPVHHFLLSESLVLETQGGPSKCSLGRTDAGQVPGHPSSLLGVTVVKGGKAGKLPFGLA